MTTSVKNETKVQSPEAGERKTWKGRFSLVSPWFADIVSSIKQQLKSEHLSLDPVFVRTHFSGLPLHRISQEELRAVYLREILSGQNQLAEFVANRWLFKNLPLYTFFEGQLEKIGGNIETIEAIADEQAILMIQSALEKSFSIDDVFCFVTLNDVRFSDEVFVDLHKKALELLSERNKPALKKENCREEKLEDELKKTKEKCEKRVAELTRKHELELTKLHKEIRELKLKLKEQK